MWIDDDPWPPEPPPRPPKRYMISLGGDHSNVVGTLTLEQDVVDQFEAGVEFELSTYMQPDAEEWNDGVQRITHSQLHGFTLFPVEAEPKSFPLAPGLLETIAHAIEHSDDARMIAQARAALHHLNRSVNVREEQLQLEYVIDLAGERLNELRLRRADEIQAKNREALNDELYNPNKRIRKFDPLAAHDPRYGTIFDPRFGE